MSALNMQHGTGVFTGDPNGPSILHLRQNYNMLKSELKLKPNANLNDNDMYNFMMKFLGGGARDQAADLERRMRKELRDKNAASLDQYVRDRDAYTHAKALYDALPAAEKAEATAPQPPSPHEEEEVYDRPIERFWEMMEKLYPEKSTTRMDEFRNFTMKSGETMASLVQRMQSLRIALDRPEEMSVFKLLAAIRPAELGKEVTRQLHATGVEVEDWTVESVGQIAIRLDRATTQANLWSTTSSAGTAATTRSGPVRTQFGNAAPSGKRFDPRGCHNCGEVGHIARFCRKPATVKGGMAQTTSAPQKGNNRECYHCGAPDHFAGQCPKKRAERAQPGAAKMWCSYHKRDTHNTADCKAMQSGKTAPKPHANARAAQTADPGEEVPKPTMAQLLELWDAHHNSTAYMAQTYTSAPSARVVSVHSDVPRNAVNKDEKRRGPLSDMPLSFRPKDFWSTPAQPLLAPTATTDEMTATPEVTPVLDDVPTAESETTQAPEPAPTPATDTTASPVCPSPLEVAQPMPASFQELPTDAPSRQGTNYGPSVPPTAVVVPTENLPFQRGKPLRGLRSAAMDNLYDVNNPNLGALLSHLPGAYHSDRTTGFHRSPRVDNSGKRPAMLVNGRVLHNLLLDTGAEAVIAGRASATAMGIAPDMISRGAIKIRTCTGALTERLDQTKQPVRFTLNPGTPEEVTVMAHVVILNADVADTLIGMSVMGPLEMVPDLRKKRVKYYLEEEAGTRKCFLPCKFPIDYSSLLPTSRVLQAYGGIVIPIMPTPNNAENIYVACARLEAHRKEMLAEITDNFDRNIRVLAKADPQAPTHTNTAYSHITRLNHMFVDKREAFSTVGPGMVVVELFSGLMATTEALLRQGVKIRKVYACEIDDKTRKIATRRLAVLHAMFPQLLSVEAFKDCHDALGHDVSKINRRDLARIEKPDLVVAGFPCQGFSRAAARALGLRDSRTSLFEDAVRVVHQINDIWGGSVGYLFENVDASDHPQDDVREEFNTVVKGVLGRGFAFDAVAVGSYAHRHRHWWTNLVPSNLMLAMVERRSKHRKPDQIVQNILQPGHTAQTARHDRAPGRHSVNVVGQPLRAFATFVTVRGSYAYRAGQHSLIRQANGTWDEPTALERERAMGFMDNTTKVCPSISEADRRRILGSTMDLHALQFLVGGIQCFQMAMFSD